ncbi:MAG: glycerate kinase [Acidobacteria bacterium]|nr:MAG: glycerate kinase [Acidobacteriota bacterium]
MRFGPRRARVCGKRYYGGVQPAPDLRQIVRHIYEAALRSVDPEAAVLRFLRREGDLLRLADRTYQLSSFRRIVLVGFGKAGVPMAKAVEQIFGDRLDQGLIIVKYGHGGQLKKTLVVEAGHPEPDEAGRAGAEELLSLLDRTVSSQDLLIVLLSGGGSALAPAPVSGVSLDDKKRTTSLLLRCGATIHEMNCVRKHLSRIKGGRLLDHAHGATVLALMLSDVVGDDMSTVASGATVPDPTTFRDALDILSAYRLESELPATVWRYLERGAAGDPHAPETLKPGSVASRHIQNVIVGSNFLGLRAAAEKSRELGFAPLILSSSIEGNTADIAKMHVALAQEVLKTGHPLARPCCLISGGETTVKVTGSGKGGRNQEFVLCCAKETAGWPEDRILFASLGSDGTDGPTDAAGALADPRSKSRGDELGLSLDDHLARNDSYNFFNPLADLIRTGPTRTNVMDFRFVLIG